MNELPDQEFVSKLRVAVITYLQVVDRWEAAYRKYYRMPGHARTISSDMEQEQRESVAQWRILQAMPLL